ncbi:MAG: hypothetical protein U0T81_07445 [Saprospiraceae bacterium]
MMKSYFQGVLFSSALLSSNDGRLFDQLFELFKELLMMTGGSVDEAVQWLHELDRQYHLSRPDYGLADFLRDLEARGFITRSGPYQQLAPSSKMDADIRRSAFEDLFGKILRSGSGRHNTKKEGQGFDLSESARPYAFGDRFTDIQSADTLRNALIAQGIDDFSFTEKDLVIRDQIDQSLCSTVLMIDISHSMILYGEDRITPAKKVALALAQMIRQIYPKDSLDIIVFGDDAWAVELKDLPYLQVGPYHTNTIAGLELAYQLLLKRRGSNKNIMMITDGKPTCMKRGKEYYKNAFGLDRQIVNRTISAGKKCNKHGINITTFMVASDPYLISFVEEFSDKVHGKAFYTNLEGLGKQIFINYENNRKKKK